MTIQTKVIFAESLLDAKLFREPGKYTVAQTTNKSGIFDFFYTPYLSSFENRVETFLEQFAITAPFELRTATIISSVLIALKNDLMFISIKVLISEFHEQKISGDLQGEDAESRYQWYDNQFLNYEFHRDLLQRYPVMAYLIQSLLNSKLELLQEAFQRLEQDYTALAERMLLSFDTVNDILLNTGDTHNGGKSVVIFSLGDMERRVVYKPHTLMPESSYNQVLDWLNRKKKLAMEVANTNAIDAGEYGWQEYVEQRACTSLKEVERYYYRIGVHLALMYMLKCGDIHLENLVSDGEFPRMIDLETLLTQQNPIPLAESFLTDFLKSVDNSVLGTMLLPQKFGLSTFDIDLSGLHGGGGETSSYLETYRLMNVGTDDIRLVKQFVVTEENRNRVLYEGGKIDPSQYSLYIQAGFAGAYCVIEEYKEELIQLIGKGLLFQGKYRQVLRPTHIYARYIEAGNHPNYLRKWEDREKLFSLLYGDLPKNQVKIRERTGYEIQSLMFNDVPYFTVGFNSNDLMTGEKNQIDQYYDTVLSDQLLMRIRRLDEQDMKRQMSYIRMSLSTLKNVSWGHGDDKKNGDLPDGGEFRFTDLDHWLGCAKEIGDWMESNSLASSDGMRCSWLSLLVADDRKLSLGPANYTLYEGSGIILFLAYLAKLSGEDKYDRLAKAAYEGMEDLYHPEQLVLSSSAYYGFGSLLYLYYSLWVLWGGDSLYAKFIRQIQRIMEIEIEEDASLDIVSGMAGTVIVCLNIYRTDGNSDLLAVASRWGEELYRRLSVNVSGRLSGLSHGYAGYAWALALLGESVNKTVYTELAFALIEEENKNYDPVVGNWRSMRPKEYDSDLIYWCHGAPGIGLSRARMASFISDVNRTGLLHRDARRAIDKLMKDGFDERLDDSLCHGIFGNIDIALDIAQLTGDQHLLQEVSKKARSAVQRIARRGARYGLGCITDITGFMLGLSGIGYVLLRLSDSRIPSVLALEAARKEEV